MDVLDTLRDETDKDGDDNVYDQNTVGNVYGYQGNTNERNLYMQRHDNEEHKPHKRINLFVFFLVLKEFSSHQKKIAP